MIVALWLKNRIFCYGVNLIRERQLMKKSVVHCVNRQYRISVWLKITIVFTIQSWIKYLSEDIAAYNSFVKQKSYAPFVIGAMKQAWAEFALHIIVFVRRKPCETLSAEYTMNQSVVLFRLQSRTSILPSNNAAYNSFIYQKMFSSMYRCCNKVVVSNLSLHIVVIYGDEPCDTLSAKFTIPKMMV